MRRAVSRRGVFFWRYLGEPLIDEKAGRRKRPKLCICTVQSCMCEKIWYRNFSMDKTFAGDYDCFLGEGDESVSLNNQSSSWYVGAASLRLKALVITNEISRFATREGIKSRSTKLGGDLEELKLLRISDEGGREKRKRKREERRNLVATVTQSWRYAK